MKIFILSLLLNIAAGAASLVTITAASGTLPGGTSTATSIQITQILPTGGVISYGTISYTGGYVIRLLGDSPTQLRYRIDYLNSSRVIVYTEYFSIPAFPSATSRAAILSTVSGPITPGTGQNENLSGTKNSVNLTFTTLQTPITATFQLYRNGLFQVSGVNYTLSGGVVSMIVAPRSDDTLVANYIY